MEGYLITFRVDTAYPVPSLEFTLPAGDYPQPLSLVPKIKEFIEENKIDMEVAKADGYLFIEKFKGDLCAIPDIYEVADLLAD